MKKHLLTLTLVLLSTNAFATEVRFNHYDPYINCQHLVEIAARGVDPKADSKSAKLQAAEIVIDYTYENCKEILGKSLLAAIEESRRVHQISASPAADQQHEAVVTGISPENKSLIQLWQKMRTLSAEKLQQIREHVEALLNEEGH